MKFKRRTIKAYLDGKFLCDVVKAALDSNKTVEEIKQILICENPGHSVTFKAV